MKKHFYTCLLFSTVSLNALSQITVDNTTMTPEQLVQNVLVGTGVTVSNVKWNGSAADALVVQEMAGTFTGTSTAGLTYGVIMGSGDVTEAVGPNSSGSISMGGPGTGATDPDLDAISTAPIFDKAVLEFDFVPQGDSIRFRYVFSSDEYPEFVCSGYNDIFGFFISGPNPAGGSYVAQNLAIIPGSGGLPVAINTVNPGVVGTSGTPGGCTSLAYSSYYINNLGGLTIEFDGLTVIMTAQAPVVCGQTYHIKLAIADAGDPGYDSGVFLEAGSFSSNAVEVNLITTSGSNDITEGCAQGGTFTFTRTDDDDTLTIPVIIGGDAINGTDYTPAIPSSITFLPGVDSVGISFTAVLDGLPEGTDSLVITIINVNDCGDTIVSTATLYIHDPMPLSIDLGPDLVLGCTGGAVTLDPGATGGYSPYTYVWSTGASSPTISHTVTGPEQIILTVNGLCSSTDTDTLNITIVPPTPQHWVGPVFSSYCPNDTLTIAPQYLSGGSSPFTYSWAAGGTGPSLVVSPNDTTTYAVTITDFCGQDTTVNVTVNVRTPTPIDVQIASETVCKELDGSVVIVPVLTGGNGNVTYSWYENSPGNIGSIGANGVIIVPNAGAGGMFVVTVIDECYLTSTDTADIVVEDCKPIIPNIITPNGDGINDFFTILNLDRHPNSGLTIFNRWGQEVYKSGNYQNDWKGDGVNDGVYYYILILTDGSNPSSYTGFVHVTGKG